MLPKSNPKCIQNRIKLASNFSSILIPKIIQNASKKGGENLRKLGFGRLGGHWNPQGAPEATNLAEKEPKEPPRPPKCSPGDTQKWKNGDPEATNLAKMEPKGPPRLPKCSPGHTQKWKNGDQGIPRAPKMQPWRRPKLQKWNPRDPLSSQNEHRGIQGA